MKRFATSIALLAVLAVFGGLLWRLFDLRFASGDVYPPGSSLRADPLGARAFYESLDLVPGLRVQRLLEPIRRLGSGQDTTLFILACQPWNDRILNPQDAQELDDFLIQGGRVVITFQAIAGKPPNWQNNFSAATASPTNRPGRRGGKRSSSTNETRQSRPVSFAEHWGFQFEYQPLAHSSDGVTQPAIAARNPDAPATLPETLNWHSAASFAGLSNRWSVLYTCSNQPVVVERTLGRGALVLASDSYFHSNEALRRDRATTLLTWLTGNHERLVFEETHLGSELHPGIITLARRYRLHGLGAGLMVLAGLFVWRTATRFIPQPAVKPSEEELITGRDSATGFVNLLRRAVPPAELLPLCLAEWKKSQPRDRADLKRKTAAMQDLVNLEAARPVKEQRPVDAYRQLSRIQIEY
jgi:hypothetical protein